MAFAHSVRPFVWRKLSHEGGTDAGRKQINIGVAFIQQRSVKVRVRASASVRRRSCIFSPRQEMSHNNFLFLVVVHDFYLVAHYVVQKILQ